MPGMNVKKGDTVKVIAGKDKGKQGEIIRSMPSKGRVVVEKVNVVKKAQRPTQENQNGGFKEMEAKIDVSNVMLVCPGCGKPSRVGHAKNDEGKKVRVCKKCGHQF